MVLSFTVNGVARQVDCDPRERLLDVLRERLELRGTKYGCGEGECGACTVALEGRVVNACLTTAGQAHGGEVTTIEAMPANLLGRRLLDGFVESGAVQCGFCTPGFVLAARELLHRSGAPDLEQIREGLSGNLCRCTGYAAIVEGVGRAAGWTPAAAPGLEAGAAAAPRLAIATEGYARPATLAEALHLLAAPGAGWRVLAGGTDLLTRHGDRLRSLALLDLGLLDELQGVRETDHELHLGARTFFTALARSPLVERWAPALAAAARQVGGVQIQNAATLGGNLVNGSPAADGAPPLAALDARLVLRSARGARQVALVASAGAQGPAFAQGPGRTLLAPDELLVEIVVPKRQAAGRRVDLFEKVGPRKALTIAKASVALTGWLEGGRWHDVRIALGAVAPTVILAERAAALLTSAPFDQGLLLRAAEAAAADCAPIDDLRSTAGHRRRLVRGLLVRGLWALAAGAAT